MKEKRGIDHSKDRYYAVSARGFIRPHEMAKDVFFWGLISSSILFIIAIVLMLNVAESVIPFFSWLLFGIDAIFILTLSIHHYLWARSMTHADGFTILYDITSREYVIYLRRGKERRLPARSIIDIKVGYNCFFNPISELFNLKNRHIGNLIFIYRSAEGIEERLVAHDVDQPEIALLRVGIVKSKFLAGLEEVKVRDDGHIEIEGEENGASSKITIENEGAIEEASLEGEVKVEETPLEEKKE